MSQKLPRYGMHKYWGKKPPEQLRSLLDEFTKEGDIVLDPFSGYGVFTAEAYINKRNVISNDLNPIASFIQKQLLTHEFNISRLENLSDDIIVQTLSENIFWNIIKCPKCGHDARVIATLRTKQDIPVKAKIQCKCTKASIEFTLSQTQIDYILNQEHNVSLMDHPVSKIIPNSRISAYKGLTTDDLFTVRALSSHIALFDAINQVSDKVYKDLLLLAFTSNLANCSRLVPPIKSRGEMASGAWMTGFYIGETYIENNVFHYFKNRVQKLVSGKKDFIKALKKNISLHQYNGEVASINEMTIENTSYIIDSLDTKKLPYPDNSIDYIFADPPYGDSVPYFEQSIIWNTWLGFSVDYNNEVVVSDSKKRVKTIKEFGSDIEQCLYEIHRVLKPQKYFTLTFHSISGEEWYAILNGCLKNNFQLHKIEWLTQKTFTPRQLNRTKTVKGDMMITFLKSTSSNQHQILSFNETVALIVNTTKQLMSKITYVDTNNIYMVLLQEFFSKHIIIAKVNILEILSKYFSINEEGLWFI
ncbi:DNA methyltransferase [Sulfurospirillum oryzae]|uniref:DNA methyltransferase n=1 Tax=Sulfurospirillum oryzae TaxID=2976535 RepID=UPI0021E8FAE8|nr:DNA methyltransferase [Sulfurospirillum oryzae]